MLMWVKCIHGKFRSHQITKKRRNRWYLLYKSMTEGRAQKWWRKLCKYWKGYSRACFPSSLKMGSRGFLRLSRWNSSLELLVLLGLAHNYSFISFFCYCQSSTDEWDTIYQMKGPHNGLLFAKITYHHAVRRVAHASALSRLANF